MRTLRWLIIVALVTPGAGCTWVRDNMGINKEPPRGSGPIQKVTADQLTGYLNIQAAKIQTLSYGEARLVARDHGVPMPSLRGNLAASQPRNFRMTGQGGAMGAKVDLGSNPDQFWVYFDAPTVKPMFVFASHTDFENGRAKLPGGIPFEPDWVMQALGMTTYPATHQYTAEVNEKERTYTLSWQTTTPSGLQVRKEVIFDSDDAAGTRPQVKRHVIRDMKGKIICVADVKSARTVPLGAPVAPVAPGTPGADPRAATGATVQYPTQIVLRWEEQKFEMDLSLDGAQVNQQLTDEQTRRLFSRPNIPGATPVDLARYDVSAPR